MFEDKVVVGPQKSFSHDDLMEYVEHLLKESRSYEERSTLSSNYSWLRSRSLEAAPHSLELDKFKPVVQKMSSESCVVIAVKLDSLTDLKTPAEILKNFQKLLEERCSIEMFDSVKRAKETKNGTSNRKRNRVHPELLPPGRQPTVSFILN